MKWILTLYSVILPLVLVAQAVDNRLDPARRQHLRDSLYEQYLMSERDPEAMIQEIMLRVHEIPHPERWPLVQIGLLLENRISGPSEAVFMLNMSAGQLIGSINKKLALPYYNKAVAAWRHLPEIPAYHVFQLFSNKAGCHLERMEYDSVTYCYQIATTQAICDGALAHAAALNNMGYFFVGRARPDSARYYLDQALSVLGPGSLEYDLYLSILGNKAQVDMQERRYPEAIRTFTFIDSANYALKRPFHFIRNKVRLLQALHLQNTSTVRITDEIRQLTTYIDSFAGHRDQEVVSQFYEFAENYFFEHPHTDFLPIYRSRLQTMKKELEKAKRERLDELTQSLLFLQEQEFSAELQFHQLRNEKNELALKASRWSALTILVSAILVISLLIIYIRDRKRKLMVTAQQAEQELRTKQMQSKILEQELQLKKKDLTHVVLHNLQVYDSNQQIIDRLERMATRKVTEPEVRSLVTELQIKNQVSERSIELQSKIDVVNAAFYEDLDRKFPALSKAEKELCSYIRINLSTKDISILKNVEALSIKRAKNRLRKKLGLQPDDDLYRFISGI